MRALVLVAFAMVASCKKPDATPPPAPSASSSASPSASAAAKPVDAHPGTAYGVGAAKTEAIVHKWNAAINAHDADALGALYADSIELYGETVPRDRAIAMKKAAFAWHVRDDLDAIAASDSGRATFHKKSTQKGGKVIDVVGYLDVRDGKIVSEGDTTTDKNLARAHEVSCDDAVLALAEATAEAKKATDEISKTIPVGGMVLPPDAGQHDWTVNVCENHPDRMMCLHHFTVDATTGKITYAFGADDPRPVAGDPVLAAKVRIACAR